MEINKKLFLLIIFFFPLFAFAETYTGDAGSAQMAGDFITDLWTFLESDIPSFIQRTYAYIIEKLTVIQIMLKIETLKLSWSIGGRILENYDIASKIASQADSLPQNVKAMLIDVRFFDGLNFILQAGVARFAMRFM